MRRFLTYISFCLLALAVPQRVLSQTAADSSDSQEPADTSDLFLNAYMANEQGEKLENEGDTAKALEKYRYSASLLDQITRDDPKWQPIVVEYRKKRVSANILRLQQVAGGQPPPSSSTPDANSVPIDGELPQKENPIPDLGQSSQPSEPSQPAPIAPPPANAPQQVRDELAELQSDLRDSQQKLKSVETEKAALANRLDDALRQLDQTKVNDAELRGQLKQAQDAYQNALVDHSQSPNVSKQYQARITQLENALKDAEADRDAADEEHSDDTRRAVKAREATAAIVQQRDAATAQVKDLQGKFADASKLAAKLDAANKQIAALTKDRDDATQRADDLDKQLASSSKTAAALVAAQKEIASLKAADTQTAAKSSEIDAKLADARKQINQITADRDNVRQQVTALNGKLADAQTEIVSVKTQRDQIATQRDQALAELSKARDAEKRVNELIADNNTLTQKLAADDKTIKNFKSDSPEKDKQIAELRKEVSDTKALLTSTQHDRDNIQSTLNDLQQQYDSTTAELTELKANNAVSASEKKTLTDENDLLRGIVLRELRGEAGRDQARRLVLTQLAQLGVQSDTLLKRIDYLGEPVVQLTDKEKSLFKDPAIDIPDASDSSLDFSFAAPKQPAHTSAADSDGPPPSDAPPAPSTPAPSIPASSTPAPSTPAPADAQPIEHTVPAPAPAAAVSTPVPTPPPSAAVATPTPTEMASLSKTEVSPEKALSSSSPAPAEAPDSLSSGESQASGTSQSGLTAPPAPLVPPDLEDAARAAKDAFERGDYRDAEKTYEKMLTEAPNNVYILSNLGVVYFRNEKWKLAEESLKKAIAVAPEDTFSWCTLGIVYYQEKRYDDAINSLTRALAINPKYAVAHNYLGITASQKGWQEAALKELETAIELDPNYGDAFFNLAVVYAMQQPPNKDLALKYYKRATDLGAEPDAALEQLLK
jgi:Flp pilus assembly protein TadD/uncharacterized coiled-coil DUF342 family protein